MSNPCISSSKVAGTAVYNANGDKLGSIDIVVIDKVSVAKASRRAPWPAATRATESRVVR